MVLVLKKLRYENVMLKLTWMPSPDEGRALRNGPVDRFSEGARRRAGLCRTDIILTGSRLPIKKPSFQRAFVLFLFLLDFLEIGLGFGGDIFFVVFFAIGSVLFV